MEHYWELKYGSYDDLRSVFIPPDRVVAVRKRWDSGQPIHLSVGTVPANQIRSFELTDRPYKPSQPQLESGQLLEDAAQAFDEALEVEVDGEVMVRARWVKQTTTPQQWAKHYAHIPGYHQLDGRGDMVVMAFRLPAHKVNYLNTPYCTEEEIRLLTSKT